MFGNVCGETKEQGRDGSRIQATVQGDSRAVRLRRVTGGVTTSARVSDPTQESSRVSDQLPRRALSVRQPWAELIMRGNKTLEVRSRPTKVRGLVQIYSSLKLEVGPKQLQAAHRYGLDLDQLPRGVLIGVVEIVGSRPVSPSDSAAAGFNIPEDANLHGWVLENPHRFQVFTKPQRQPQPSFFFVY